MKGGHYVGMWQKFSKEPNIVFLIFSEKSVEKLRKWHQDGFDIFIISEDMGKYCTKYSKSFLLIYLCLKWADNVTSNNASHEFRYLREFSI